MKKRAPKKKLRYPDNTANSMTGKVPFYIPELRLTVYVEPTANVTEVREKYLSQHQHELKRIAY